MRDYPKDYATRYALWRAYGMKCFYCGEPVDFLSLNVDHLVPRSLLADEQHLETVLAEYDIVKNYPDFTIGSLSNLVPSHSACNLRKSDSLFPKPATLFYLSRTHDMLPKVLSELECLTVTARRGEVLGGLSTMLGRGDISEREVAEILSGWRFRMISNEPPVICFGLNFFETLDMRGMTISDPSGYATVCDHLESELTEILRSVTLNSFHYSEPSKRNGETLSVRLVFPELEIDDVKHLRLERVEQLMPWWKLLEIANFYQIYGLRYQEAVNQSLDRNEEYRG